MTNDKGSTRPETRDRRRVTTAVACVACVIAIAGDGVLAGYHPHGGWRFLVAAGLLVDAAGLLSALLYLRSTRRRP